MQLARSWSARPCRCSEYYANKNYMRQLVSIPITERGFVVQPSAKPTSISVRKCSTPNTFAKTYPWFTKVSPALPASPRDTYLALDMLDMSSGGTDAASTALWATCVIMFTGAILTGLPALAGSSDQTQPPSSRGGYTLSGILRGEGMRLLSAGLMLGSGLGVIIPEGFFTFSEGAEAAAAAASSGSGGSGLEPQPLPEWAAGAAITSGFLGMLMLQLALQHPDHQHGSSGTHHHVSTQHPHSRGNTRHVDHSDSGDVESPLVGVAAAGPAAGSAVGPGPRTNPGYVALATAEAETELQDVPGRVGGSAAAVTAINPSSLGMELSRRRIPKVPSLLSSSVPYSLVKCTAEDDEAAVARPAEEPVAAAATGAGGSAGSDGGGSGGGDGACAMTGAAAATRASSSRLALGGLLVHSAADGIALGAASLGAGGQGPDGGSGAVSALSLTVAVTILLHKLPVTWGLTTYLRHAGWSRGAALRGLLAFAASAPLAALTAFYLLRAVLMTPTTPTPGSLLDPWVSAGAGDDGGGALRSQWVALALLFSGGTFLAAATQHILPEALGMESDSVRASSGRGGLHGGHEAAAAAAGGGLGVAEEGMAVAPIAVGRAVSLGGTKGAGAVGRGGDVLRLFLLVSGAVVPLTIAALLPE